MFELVEAVVPASDHLGQQWSPPGDDEAKKALLKQLKKDFPKEATSWLKDPQVTVEAPTRVSPERIDWDEYPEWRASRQLKPIVKIAKKLRKGKTPKPAVMADRPGTDELDVLDGHHHVLGAVDAKKDPLAWIVHVPSDRGPWDTMHDQQKHDSRKDDFGKTSRYDRDD